VIPSVVSEQVQTGVEDFLRTTFPITNPFFAGALERLLESPNGLFRGPYLTIKLPFVPASGERRWFADLLPEEFQPYRHQEQSWQRLQRLAGASTIVATGTGSGKTECFLYPILDYCRATSGRKGIKAILIYPMNALATDQAKRLAATIWKHPDLRGQVTAGLYIGEQPKQPASAMTEDEIITDKNLLRQNPPDILLTNYKMLDYLLIRPGDFPLWGDNEPETLKYLVVDELHTFDGAQGADLACLIRRIKERLKTPEKYLCCVGTSATLGSGENEAQPQDLVTFAQHVFGEPFDENSIIGESLLTVDEFLRGCLVTRFQPPGQDATAQLNPLAYDEVQAYIQAQHRLWLTANLDDYQDTEWRLRLGAELKSHAFFRNLLTILGNRAVALSELEGQIRKQLPGFREKDAQYLEHLLESFLSLVSEARARQGNRVIPLVQVRHQLWLRELRRMVAVVQRDPTLSFADDLKTEERKRSLPVIHCRECGLTGWSGTMRDADTRVNPDLQTFYNAFFANSPHVVFLFPDAFKASDSQRALPTFLCSECLEVQRQTEPGECGNCGSGFDRLIPVWVPDTNRTVAHQNGQQRREGLHDCPSCGGHNSLTILGSRAASLTSVIIAQLFTSPFNADKKLLAFSDSVQDASHRSGFFSARTYTFNLRAALQKVVMASDTPIPLHLLPQRFLEYWKQRLTEANFVATFLPPDMNWLDDYEQLRRTGAVPAGCDLVNRLERRLDWEIWSEYTFDCRIGRTLEKTGASTLRIKPEVWEGLLEAALPNLQEHTGLRELDRETLARFLGGLLINLKNKGGVLQSEIGGYIDSLGNWWLLGKQKGKAVHRPNISSYSRLPVFLTARGGDRFQTLVRGAGNPTPTWYEDWLEKCFYAIDPTVGSYAKEVYELLIPILVQRGLLFERFARGTAIWGLKPDVLEATTAVVQFRCRFCSYSISAAESAAPVFEGCPCLRYKCDGTLERQAAGDDYYRRLYEAGDVQRIFSEEHTGLLDRETRERVEEGFRHRQLPGDPNLLSCTPTLEMGINIGDLSSLALCSVPPKPSNYLQRAGRAGRVNGNSFIFAVANARPHDLFFFFEPKEMLEGLVEPPGCFLNASAVLERQFTAFVFDRWVESGIAADQLPEEMRPVLDAIEANRIQDGFPANLLSFFEKRKGELEDAFLRLFGAEVADYTRERIRAFSRGGDVEIRGLEESIWRGLREVAEERKGFRNRIEGLRRKTRQLQQDPAQDQTTEDAIRQMQLERSALSELVRTINERKVLNFFTDEGLLPNYAFPEAGVELRSIIYRYNPDAQGDENKYKTNIFEYERPAAAAILELAPANHFYAEGRRLEIDQISLQHSKLEVWRFCDTCSHMALDANLEERDQCPKCGSPMWSDEGQRRTILRMRQVVSTMSEQESRSYDESDDREPQFYQKNMFVEKNDADITQAFFIDKEEVPFGFEFFRKITLREINFGEKVVAGGRIRIAGRDLFDKPFEICRGCGKIRKGARFEHAVYCRYWGNEQQERIIEACYIYREFDSEAIRMLLPVASFDVERNVHSFVAALDLGLRKKFRGDPGHLLTTLMDEPVPGSDVRKRYLVLYDGVPGGTGYLKELMRDQRNLIEVFERAYDVLVNCPCQNDPEKDGCYRCLLAYRGRHDYLSTSRQAAIQLLSMILDNKDQLKPTERLDAIRLNRLLESELEGRFVEALRRTADGEPQRSLTGQVVNGKEGFYLRTVHGSYLIEPQVELGPRQGVQIPSRADFVIYPERPISGELPIAIFTDGYEFHADPASTLRTGLDTAQRLAIMRSGRYRVWSLTWEDVEDYFGARPAEFSGELFPPSPRLPALLATVDSANGGRWRQLAGRSSFGLLLLLLGESRSWNWRTYAAAYLASLLENVRCGKGDAFSHRDILLKEEIHAEWPPPLDATALGSSPWLVGRLERKTDAGVILARAFVAFEAASITARRMDRLVSCFRLEDTSAKDDPVVWKRTWREYLRLMNLLQFVDGVDFVSANGLREQAYGSLLDESVLLGQTQSMPEQVGSLLELVDDAARPLLVIAVESGAPMPEPGFELATDEGEIVATAELAWPALRVAVLLERESAERQQFESCGWRVFLATELASDSGPLLAALLPEERT